MKNYIITGVTFDNKRVTPIVCTKTQLQAKISTLRKGSIWTPVMYGNIYRKLYGKFENNNIKIK